MNANEGQINDQISTDYINENDLPAMASLWNKYYEVLTTSKRIFNSESIKQSYSTRFNREHEWYGLYIDGTLQGFLICEESCINEQILKLKMMAISPKYQGNGYASKLIDFVLEEHKKKKIIITKLTTEVVESNISTKNKLISLGFSIVKFDSEFRDYILEKKLIN